MPLPSVVSSLKILMQKHRFNTPLECFRDLGQVLGQKSMRPAQYNAAPRTIAQAVAQPGRAPNLEAAPVTTGWWSVWVGVP